MVHPWILWTQAAACDTVLRGISVIKQLYQKPMQMRTGALRKQLDMMMMIMLLGLVDVHIIIGTCACRM